MEWVLRLANTSIIKKQVMALTGLGLCAFLVVHLLGNFLIFVGAESFNMYAYYLTSNKALLYTAEAGLVLVFASHLFMAFKLTMENKNARNQRYVYPNKTGQGATFASRTMILTGIIIFGFIIMHLLNFKYGTMYYVTYDGLEVRDLYKTVVEHFVNPINVVAYIVCMISLGVHLSHGFVSAFQSLGLNHPKFNAAIDKLGVVYFLFVAIGFSTLPIFCYFTGVNS